MFEYLSDYATDFGFHVIEYLHGFNHAKRIAHIDAAANFDVGPGFRIGRGVKGTDHR